MSAHLAGALSPTRPNAVFGGSGKPSRQLVSRRPEPPSRRKPTPCSCQAAKGFGKGSKKSQRKNDSNWINIARMSEFPADRPTKAIVLKDKSVVMLYNVDGKVYCSDANSTAYKYPLSHAKVLKGKSGPAVEVPLDGTVYDLQTGKVLEWCPKNNLIRKVLGAIKSNQQPVKLKVYPAQVDDDGTISVQFYNPNSAPS